MSVCTWLSAHGSSCAEAFGFATGIANVWLVTRESIWSWPLGVVNAVFYMIVFARTGLYSDTGLQVVYFTLSLYGWWHWWRGGPQREAVIVTRTSHRQTITLGTIIVGTWVALAVITSRLPGVALPWLDSLLVAISLVAQWMMTRKLLENWLLWIAVDVVYIGLFINRGLPLTAVLYTVFLGLATLGYVQWRTSEARHTATP